MAILSTKCVKYLWSTLHYVHTESTRAFVYDKLFALACRCINPSDHSLHYNETFHFSDKELSLAIAGYKRLGILGILSAYFNGSMINPCIDTQGERMVFCLKRAFIHMPATTAAVIMKGFNYSLSDEMVRWIYSSYGLSQGMKELRNVYNWNEINRRIIRLEALLGNDVPCTETKTVQKRFLAMYHYITADQRKKELAIESCGLKRSLFFYHWKSFTRYGVIGLIDKGNEIFRDSKVGIDNEARFVIDKIQHPERNEQFYLDKLKTMGIKVDRSCIAKIFSRWKVKEYHSEFVSNLERLESDIETKEYTYDSIDIDNQIEKLADKNFMNMFKGMDEYGLYVSAPGIFTLWAYLEELGILKIISSMGLSCNPGGKGYTWLDLVLLDISRRFYGIETHSRMCQHEESSLSFFAHLLALPCNDSFLDGLGRISQEHIFQLRKWLIGKNKQLGLFDGRKIAFDFHHIDLDVEMGILRKIGKGPSWKKKICYNGFRPHIAWDIESGNLIVAEYRKGSARGTTTIKRFIKDFIFVEFKELFDTVYIDSEYTGKDSWSFIMNGMGADLTACLKQNRWVKRHRDQFLLKHVNDHNFWFYYDEDHVYSSKKFELVWDYTDKQSEQTTKLTLYCVVKKNIKNGRFRCFGTSKPELSSIMILKDYSHRWCIENGINDLIKSYFLDKCPGTVPHHVDVHFFIVSLCRYLFRMVERDLGDFLKNPDGTTKTLSSMREKLFRQGCARIYRKSDTIEIRFQQSYSVELTNQLRKWFDCLYQRFENGLEILGGYKLKFVLAVPLGEHYKNNHKKIPLCEGKFFTTDDKKL